MLKAWIFAPSPPSAEEMMANMTPEELKRLEKKQRQEGRVKYRRA
jgi:hypothetical protein